MAEFLGRTLYFGDNALASFRDDIELRRLAIAHELGHALQHYRSLSDLPAKPTNEESRVYEAHADALGQGILHKAGFPANTAKKGFEALINCGKSRRTDHPTPEARVLNQDLLAHRERKIHAALARLPDASSRGLDAAYDGSSGRAELPTETSAVRATPTIKPSAFNSRGILEAQHWLLDDDLVPPPSREAEHDPITSLRRRQKFREAVIAAANELISGPDVEDLIFAWTKSEIPGPADLASWLTQRAAQLASKRSPHALR